MQESSIKKTFPIQNKLQVYFLLVSIIPLLAMGFFSLSYSTAPMRQFAIAPVQTHLLSISNYIKKELYNVREDALYLSHLPSLSRMLEFSPNAMPDEQLKFIQDAANDFIEILNKRKKYFYISYIDQTGMEKLRINFLHRDKWEIILGDKLQNKSDTEFFRNTINLKTGKVYFSEIELIEEYGVLKSPLTQVIYSSTPVEGISAQVRGIITVAYMVSDLFKPVYDWKINEYPDSNVFVMNSSGFYLAHSDKSKEWGKKQQKEMKWSILNDFPKAITDKLIDNNGFNIIESEDLALMKVPCYPEFVSPDNYWYIVAEVPVKKIYSQILKFKLVLLSILAVSVLVALLLAMILSSQFTKPIKTLRNGAEIIRKGDLSHKISLNNNDELGELAQDFNLMTSRLEELYRNLENKVNERTRQLQEAMDKLKENEIQLQSANQLKLDFLTNLSKELRGPLTSVTGFISLLMNKVYGDLNEKQIESLQKSKRNLYHIFKWLDGIIRISSLSNLQSSEYALHKTEFDVADSINLALKNLNYIIQEQEIKVNFSYEDKLPVKVYTDKEKIDETIASILNGLLHYPLTKNIDIFIDIITEKFENEKDIIIEFNLKFPKDINIEDFFKALEEPFIYTPNYFNITNLNTNVARTLVELLGGKYSVKLDKKENELIVEIRLKETR